MALVALLLVALGAWAPALALVASALVALALASLAASAEMMAPSVAYINRLAMLLVAYTYILFAINYFPGACFVKAVYLLLSLLALNSAFPLFFFIKMNFKL